MNDELLLNIADMSILADDKLIVDDWLAYKALKLTPRFVNIVEELYISEIVRELVFLLPIAMEDFAAESIAVL